MRAWWLAQFEALVRLLSRVFTSVVFRFEVELRRRDAPEPEAEPPRDDAGSSNKPPNTNTITLVVDFNMRFSESTSYGVHYSRVRVQTGSGQHFPVTRT